MDGETNRVYDNPNIVTRDVQRVKRMERPFSHNPNDEDQMTSDKQKHVTKKNIEGEIDL